MRYSSAFMSGERWRRIDELFHAAHALAPHERAAFLASGCAGDDDLRKEIESLLAQTHSTSAPFDHAAAAVAADLARGRAPDLTGRLIGPYQA
jgi:hypothetical protein